MSARLLLTLLCALAAAPSKADPGDAYFDRRAEGWFWYQDPPAEAEPELPEAPVVPEASPLPDPPPSPVEALESLKARLEAALAAALMEPTEANLRAYMVLDQAARNRARRFADTWQRVVWSTPALDHRLVRPVNDQAVQLFNDERVRLLDARLRAAAGEYGLFFFFRESCPFCHRFAPVLARFAATYGFRVVPITLDGGALPEYPAPRRNDRMAERLEVDTVPALFLARPDTREIHPVAFGYVGHLELAERIYTVLEGAPPNPLLATRQAGGP